MFGMKKWQVAVIGVLLAILGCLVSTVVFLLATTSTPYPTPTAIIEQKIQTKVQTMEYQLAMSGIFKDSGAALEEAAMLRKLWKTTPSLWEDSAWLAEMTQNSDKMNACYEEALLLVPPVEYDEFHRIYTSALGKLAEGAALSKEAVYEDDGSKWDRGVELFEEAKELLDQAFLLHDDLK